MCVGGRVDEVVLDYVILVIVMVGMASKRKIKIKIKIKMKKWIDNVSM